jgi:hypothetical protein
MGIIYIIEFSIIRSLTCFKIMLSLPSVAMLHHFEGSFVAAV